MAIGDQFGYNINPLLFGVTTKNQWVKSYCGQFVKVNFQCQIVLSFELRIDKVDLMST